MVVRYSTIPLSPLALKHSTLNVRLSLVSRAIGRVYLAFCAPDVQDAILLADRLGQDEVGRDDALFGIGAAGRVDAVLGRRPQALGTQQHDDHHGQRERVVEQDMLGVHQGHAGDGVLEHDGHDLGFDEAGDLGEDGGVLELVAVEAFDQLLPGMDDDLAGHRDAAQPVTELRVDGGACVNNLLMQFQADILNVPVLRPKMLESTAWGAAAMAGLKSGIFSNMSEISESWQLDRAFEPNMNIEQRQFHLDQWKTALKRSKSDI